MSEDRGTGARWGAATGIFSVVLFLVGFLVITPKPPRADAGAQAFASYYVEHQDAIRIGMVVVTLSSFFLVWFVGTLRSALADAEGPNGRLTSISFAGGVATFGFFIVAITAIAVAAYHPDEVDANLTRALNDAALLAAVPVAAALTAFFGAAACVIYRFGGLPRWSGTLAAIATALQPLALTGIFTDSGAFAPDGAIGLFAPVVGIGLGVIALSIGMLRGPAPAGT
jgi:hypothetical protein